MDPRVDEKVRVWVKLENGRPFEMSVSWDCNVNGLIEFLKSKLSPKLDTVPLDEIDLYKPEKERKDGEEHKDGGGEKPYRPSKLVWTILDEGVGVDDENPILIRTAPQDIILRDSVGIPRNPILIRTTQQGQATAAPTGDTILELKIKILELENRMLKERPPILDRPIDIGNTSRSKLQSLKKKGGDSVRSESSDTTAYGSKASGQNVPGTKASFQRKEVKKRSLAPIKNPPQFRKFIPSERRVIFDYLKPTEAKEKKYFRKLSRLLSDYTRYRLRFKLQEEKICVEFRATGVVAGEIGWNTYFVWKDQYFAWKKACSWSMANTDEEELTWNRYIYAKDESQSAQSSRSTGETAHSEPIFSGASALT